MSNKRRRTQECPITEARFSDGAWYDVDIIAPDSSRRLFLCEVHPLPASGAPTSVVRFYMHGFSSCGCVFSVL